MGVCNLSSGLHSAPKTHQLTFLGCKISPEPTPLAISAPTPGEGASSVRSGAMDEGAPAPAGSHPASWLLLSQRPLGWGHCHVLNCTIWLILC